MKTPISNTLERVLAALEKGGYTCTDEDGKRDIFAAAFLGWNDSNSEVHQIWFRDHDGLDSSGFVYITKDGIGDF